MQLVIPIRLEFKYNSYKHAGCMENKFKNNEIQLLGNIRAVVANSIDEGLAVLKADISKWMKHLLEYGVTMRDFTLVFSSDYIKENRVWASTSVVSWENFD